MVAISQRDLPYLVLTYDPNLRGVPDRPGRERQAGLPRGLTGDMICDPDYVYAAADDRTPGQLPAARAAVAAPASRLRSSLCSWSAWVLFFGASARGVGAARSRWSSRNEEPEHERTLARRKGRRGTGDPSRFVLVFNFFLFRIMGDPTTQLAKLPNSKPRGDPEASA